MAASSSSVGDALPPLPPPEIGPLGVPSTVQPGTLPKSVDAVEVAHRGILHIDQVAEGKYVLTNIITHEKADISALSCFVEFGEAQGFATVFVESGIPSTFDEFAPEHFLSKTLFQTADGEYFYTIKGNEKLRNLTMEMCQFRPLT